MANPNLALSPFIGQVGNSPAHYSRCPSEQGFYIQPDTQQPPPHGHYSPPQPPPGAPHTAPRAPPAPLPPPYYMSPPSPAPQAYYSPSPSPSPSFSPSASFASGPPPPHSPSPHHHAIAAASPVPAPAPAYYSSPGVASPGYVPPTPPCAPHFPGPVERLTKKVVKVGNRAKDVTNGFWSHLSTGHTTMRTAMGKLHNVGLLTAGTAQQFWRSNMLALSAQDALVDHFACHLATLGGPTPGTLFVGTQSVSFLSDRPVSIAMPGGYQQATPSMFKLLLPADQIASITAEQPVPPNINPQRPHEKCILIAMADGRESSFLGFIHLNKALSLLQFSFKIDPRRPRFTGAPPNPSHHPSPHSYPNTNPSQCTSPSYNPHAFIRSQSTPTPAFSQPSRTNSMPNPGQIPHLAQQPSPYYQYPAPLTSHGQVGFDHSQAGYDLSQQGYARSQTERPGSPGSDVSGSSCPGTPMSTPSLS